MHFFVSKHFLVSLPVPWPVQKQGCFMPENIPGHFGHTGKDIGFRPVYAYRTGTKKRCFFLKVMNSVPFRLERTENLVPVYKPEWGTPCSTSEKISAYSGAFRAFRSILANSGRNQRFGGHAFWVFFFPIERKITATGSSIWEMKKKKKRRTRWRHEAKPVWGRKYKRRRRRRKRWEKRLKRAAVSHWSLKIEETLELWKWGEEEKVVRWDEE